MRLAQMTFAFSALLVAASSQAAPTADPSTPIAKDGQASVLLLADEFNAGQLDRSKWNVEGPDFWVNNEQQAYVDTPETIRLLPAGSVDGADGGVLALQPNFSKGYKTTNGRTADFVSGRIDSQGKFDFTHGRAVALHGKGYSGETPSVDKQFFPDGADVTQWHEYSVDWTSDQILFKVDGRLTYRATRAMVEHYGKWNFDNATYVILNFALGGAYPFKTNGIKEPYQGVSAATVEKIKRGEVAMWVDWLRVYGSEPKR